MFDEDLPAWGRGAAPAAGGRADAPAPSRPVRAFVSSRMEELQPERQAIRTALADLLVETFVFEIDAGARPTSVLQTYLDEEDASDLYLGVFWKGYGTHTIAEFEYAASLGMACLIYEKADTTGERAPELQSFLDRLGAPETGITIARFFNAGDLAAAVKRDVAAWQARLVREARSGAGVVYGVPSRPPADFVGRGDEIARAARRLRAGQNVAIEGLPGVGKTTLALALVHHPGIRRYFRDGVLWASLGPAADASSAIVSWADGLSRYGVDPGAIARLPPHHRTQALRNAIGSRRLLLVIDDAWDLETARTLHCGGPHCAHILTTRDKAIAGECAGAASTEPLLPFDEADAYQLLQVLAPEACDADAAGVRALIRSVGALPQAVRLVGGYLARPGAGMFGDVFPGLNAGALQEMADPRRRLQLAAERLGSRDGRTTTLEETIRLSLDWLPPAALTAFAALGAFAPKPDRFAPEAAAAVTLADPTTLTLLAARNLLEVDLASRTLAVHPTIADVARAAMTADSVTRHREFYLALAQASGGATDSIAAAYPQIRFAWRQAPDDAPVFQLLAALEPFQSKRGLSADTLAWGERALVIAAAANLPAVVARVLHTTGEAARLLGRYDQALSRYRQALPIFESLQQSSSQVETLLGIGMTLSRLGRRTDALAAIETARVRAAAAGDRRAVGDSRFVAAVLSREFDAVTAAALGLEALALYQELGDVSKQAECQLFLSTVRRRQRDHAAAIAHVQSALALQASSDAAAGAEARLYMAAMSGERGQVHEALVVAEDACRVAEASGSHSLHVSALHVVADLLLRLGRTDEAIDRYRRLLALYEDVGNPSGRAGALKRLAHAHSVRYDYRDELAAYQEALRIFTNLGDRVEQAHTLEQMHYTYGHLEERDEELPCVDGAYRIWKELGDLGGQARTLFTSGMIHESARRDTAALAAYGEAAVVSVVAGDHSHRALAIESIVRVHERLAVLAVDADSHSQRDAARRHLEDAIAALTAADRIGPPDTYIAWHRTRLERRVRQVQRYGAGVLRRASVAPLEVGIGPVLSGWLCGPDRERTLRSNVDRVRQGVRAVMGVLPPIVVMSFDRQKVDENAYVISVEDVPFVTATLDPDERLFPGSSEELAPSGIPARAGFEPAGAPAAWVSRADWPALERAGRPLWTGLEYLAEHLHYVMRRHLHLFMGHQQTADLVLEHVPDIAADLRRDPVALSALVLVLRNLLEEQAPLLALRPILETFFSMYARQTERLRTLQAIRLLPDVRRRLPGNQGTGVLVQLPDALEQEIARAVRTIDRTPYVSLEPDRTQAILAMVRQTVTVHADAAALLVRDGGIRRFTRKLVELAFPNLPVLSRDELLSSGQRVIVDLVTEPPPGSATA
jgi:tetratricopeptide (TPR) repeat protein